jgi:hypothetical protein
MHNLGLIVWLIIVAFGVISSIRKNAQRAQAQRAAAPQRADAPQRVMPQPPPRPVPVAVPRPAPAMAAFAMPPVDAPQPPPRPVAPLPRKPAAPLPDSLLHEPAIRTSPIRGMFGGSATLVRAIVAAEVLGPPKAFQEQTIWSPRHSEPSI